MIRVKNVSKSFTLHNRRGAANRVPPHEAVTNRESDASAFTARRAA